MTIIEELMTKQQDEFLDHFARLGVFSKVQTLMGSGMEPEVDVIKSQEDATCSKNLRGNGSCNFTCSTFSLIQLLRSPTIIVNRATRGREGNLTREGISLARLEHLPWA